MTAEQMHGSYVEYGAQIFTPRPKYRAPGVMRFLFPLTNWAFKKKTGGGLESAFRARFCPHALKDAFDLGFGEQKLGDVENARLIIPTVNLTRANRTCSGHAIYPELFMIGT